MDEETVITLEDEIVSDLTLLYQDQATFDSDKIKIIVKKVIDEVSDIRRYKKIGYSDEQAEKDLYNYKSQIYKLAEYDFGQFGAPNEVSHSEGSVSRSWVDRSTLTSGIIPLPDL